MGSSIVFLCISTFLFPIQLWRCVYLCLAR